MIISKMKFSFVGDLFFPKRCASCRKLIEVGSDCLFCNECAHSMVKDSLVDERYPFRRVVSAYVYIDGAANVVRNMKHEYIPKVVDLAANEVLNVITANTDGKFDVVHLFRGTASMFRIHLQKRWRNAYRNLSEFRSEKRRLSKQET